MITARRRFLEGWLRVEGWGTPEAYTAGTPAVVVAMQVCHIEGVWQVGEEGALTGMRLPSGPWYVALTVDEVLQLLDGVG